MIKEWILKWFNENGTVDSEPDMDINYIDSGLIDSFGFINLIADCEEQFDINFDDDDFDSEELLTLNGLIKRIESKMI